MDQPTPTDHPGPAATTAMLRAQASAERGDWAACRQALQTVADALRSGHPALQEPALVALRRRFEALRRRSDPAWWVPLQGGGLQLRRTRSEDAAFYQSSYADLAFAHRFNRQRPWSGDLSKALHGAGVASPLDMGALHWIVCSIAPDGSAPPIGLASLTQISAANARAEVSLGLPGSAGPTSAIKALLLIYDFVFVRLRLNKLCSHVYRGNDAALHNSLRAGLREEGLLRDHYFLPPGEFVDVHVLGLTRSDFLADDRLATLARRWLGLDWRAARDAERRPAAPSAAAVATP